MNKCIGLFLLLIMPFEFVAISTIANDVEQISKSNLYFEKEIYKKPAIEALLHFPELKDTEISFVDAGKSKLAHQAIPKSLSIFRRKSKRKYLVKIASRHKNNLDSTLFANLDYSSQVGVLGHELAHIYDYMDESFCQIIGKGIKYTTNRSFRKKYERECNLEAINRDLGEEILSWSSEVHSYLMQDGRGDLYHNPDELNILLDSLNRNN